MKSRAGGQGTELGHDRSGPVLKDLANRDAVRYAEREIKIRLRPERRILASLLNGLMPCRQPTFAFAFGGRAASGGNNHAKESKPFAARRLRLVRDGSDVGRAGTADGPNRVLHPYAHRLFATRAAPLMTNQLPPVNIRVEYDSSRLDRPFDGRQRSVVKFDPAWPVPSYRPADGMRLSRGAPLVKSVTTAGRRRFRSLSGRRTRKRMFTFKLVHDLSGFCFVQGRSEPKRSRAVIEGHFDVNPRTFVTAKC